MECPENKKGEKFLWFFTIHPHLMLTRRIEQWAFSLYKQIWECSHCGVREEECGVEGKTLQRRGFNIRRLRSALLDRQVSMTPSLDRDDLIKLRILKKKK